MRLAAIDIGNDAVKGYFNGYDNQVHIPNVVAKAKENRGVIEAEKEILNGLHVELTSSALKMKNGTYKVGNLAASAAKKDELTPEVDKADSDQPIILLLTAIAYDAVQNNPDKDGIVEATYLLSTGLPLQEVKRGLSKDYRKKLRNHQHEVKFLQTPEVGGKTVRIKFEEVIVSSEGFAAFVDLTTDQQGAIKNPELIQKPILINDIGGLSTDSAIVNKAAVDNENSDGIKEGVSPYLDNIIARTFNEFKYPFHSRRAVVDVIVSEDPEERNHIWNKGNRVSIKHIIDDELSSLAEEEYKHLKKLWNRVPSLRYAYLIGGGSVVLKPYLEGINEDQEQYPLRFVKPDDSVWMIARAYIKILYTYCQKKGIELEVASTKE
ncbi:ParM/StbA family protein [Bacillus sp. RAR_GA_16]|uniref:ParM/StbA family protein n=1 Tax=Bacillus sp. RAR_GA_16 TaxID=2876774 RepID=UPI001CCD28DC|nr:ParM/StbA family protein [Bacillus sp. RAR_GA_16]MCA0174603.1 ParM/StbA family protein [Bacillus sp. RAR_GA_16]